MSSWVKYDILGRGPMIGDYVREIYNDIFDEGNIVSIDDQWISYKISRQSRSGKYIKRSKYKGVIVSTMLEHMEVDIQLMRSGLIKYILK